MRNYSFVDKPTFIDLFCGAGLFSAGFVENGFVPRLALDLDHHAISSYNRNVSEVGVVGSTDDLKLATACDVLLAGPPCQGFSTLGRRDPADERNKLCMTVPTWASAVNPKIVVIENVPPFVKSSYWAAMAQALETMGYEICVWTLDAADYGTPQKRVRAFTVASRIGAVECPTASSQPVPASVAFATIELDDPMHKWPIPSKIADQRFAVTPPLGDKRDIMRATPENCPPSWHKLGYGEATDVWGRIDPNKPSNTLRCRFSNPSTGRYVHPVENRVISLREGARLQGVPDSWIFIGHSKSIARQIGNGVPIPLARAIAQSIYHTLESASSPAIAA